MIQGSDEWFTARLGKLTASRMADVLATTKTGASASREAYAYDLAIERLTGQRNEGFKGASMQWGNDTEPMARAAYELHSGELVSEAPFIQHPTIPMAGASPDGLVGNDGQIEIKCPDKKQHMAYLRLPAAPTKYLPQINWQLACTGRAWCDFVSYDPRFPLGLQIKVVRVHRDDKEIERIEAEARAFLAEVDAIVSEMQAMLQPA